MMDLTAAVEAAKASARRTREYRAGEAFDVPADAVGQFTDGILDAALAAAAPLIGEAIAQAIEAERDKPFALVNGRISVSIAADIARKVTR